MGASLDDEENEEGHVSVYWVSGGADPVRRFVTLEQSGRVYLAQAGQDKTLTCIHLSPKQFLDLMEWGSGQRAVLEELMQGEKDEVEP